MSGKKIYIPASLDLPNALKFSQMIHSVKQAERFIFDFGDVGHMEPFGMLMVCSEIRSLLRRFPDAETRFERYEQMSYGAHMGIFQAMGLNFGKAPGEARGGARYLPLTIFQCDEIRTQAVSEAVESGISLRHEVSSYPICSAVKKRVQYSTHLRTHCEK